MLRTPAAPAHAPAPSPARQPARYAILKGLILAAAVQVALELGNVALLAIVPAHLVEDLDEDRQQRVELTLADHVGLLVDIEENAFRWNIDRTLEVAAQNLIFLALGQEEVEHRRTVDGAVFQQQRQHLEQMRFARAEKAGNPHTIGACVVRVRAEKLLQPFGHFIGQNIFLDLAAQTGLVVSLDHALDRAVNRLGKNGGHRHRGNLLDLSTYHCSGSPTDG
jgi:hypothetical protein